MFKRILVPLDGSELAERALPYARILAGRSGGRLLLLSICSSQTAEGRWLGAYLENKRRRMHSWGIPIEAHCIYRGNAADEILNFSEINDIGLMIMCTHGGSGISRWYSGSISSKVAQESYVPLLLIKSGGIHEILPLPRLSRVAVPLDGSAWAEATIPYAADLVGGPDGEITLLQINETIEPRSDTLGDPSAEWDTYCQTFATHTRERTLQYMDALQQRLRSQRLNIRFEVTSGKAAETILRHTEADDVDAIVMSTHGQSGFSHWAFGSVFNKVVQGTSKPILIVRPKPTVLIPDTVATARDRPVKGGAP